LGQQGSRHTKKVCKIEKGGVREKEENVLRLQRKSKPALGKGGRLLPLLTRTESAGDPRNSIKDVGYQGETNVAQLTLGLHGAIKR